MSDLGARMNYKQLLQRHQRIRIPMIQRDYAQGRALQEEVREEFLGALEGALLRPADDPELPLNLDFIYGSVEGAQETRFSPLDGQQRLTTLFLLHWYLAWCDDRFDDFRHLFQAREHSRFSYSVRPSSSEFFDELVAYDPRCRPTDVEKLSCRITDQSWYFRNWRLDPTIQSTLGMLDAIHGRFASAKGLFERLVSESNPAITFQLLDLDNFGLSDDLYIKMNARGKPLTQFETFKARYEQELGKQFAGETRCIDNQEFPISDFVARRMDTAWSDLFWVHRDKETNLFDGAVMNVFRAVALVTRDPGCDSYIDDILSLRNAWHSPSYSVFHSRGWLDQSFTTTLICLLEAWSGEGGAFATQLPSKKFFDEGAMFARVVANPAALSYAEVVQLAAYVSFIRKHEGTLDPPAFQDWMRIVFNLSMNTSYDRPDDLQRSIAGLNTLLAESGEVLRFFAATEKPVAGFSVQQVAEEELKATLILEHDGWRPLIDRAEGHGYFKGQIEFLLHFCGVAATINEKSKTGWDDTLHLSLQSSFKQYLNKAELMFGPHGLKDSGKCRWQRALLSVGDYLLPSRLNVSFLVNSSTDQASWKRLLRGTGLKVPEARKLLQDLWDRLTETRPAAEQLEEVIANGSIPEKWREAFIRTPEAIDYCESQAIRWNGPNEVYLLKTTQMNGAHAELFSFCLYQNVLLPLSKQGRLAPLGLGDYVSVNGTDFEPHFSLDFAGEGYELSFRIEFKRGRFVIDVTSVPALPDDDGLLLGPLGFVDSEGHLSQPVRPAEIESKLLDIAQSLAKMARSEATP